jgi:thiol-disulfide isomerase/thioredoxin
MRTIRYAALAAVALGLTVGATAHPGSHLLPALLNQAAPARPQLNRPVPPFSMTGLDGRTHTDRTLRGRVVLLDFWASWCGPCKAASPAMQRLHEQFGRQGLVVIGANTFESLDGGNAQQRREVSHRNTEAYRKEHGYTYLFSVHNDELAQRWGLRGVPAFYLIDRQGTVVWMANGWSRTHEATLRSHIQRLLR